MKTQHTPGPWTTERDYPYWNIKSGGSLIAETMLGGNVAPSQQATDDANARLIASAPELLAALELALERLNCANACRTEKQGHFMVSDIESAITKAKGEK